MNNKKMEIKRLKNDGAVKRRKEGRERLIGPQGKLTTII
jgi:hypothetical protein